MNCLSSDNHRRQDIYW